MKKSTITTFGQLDDYYKQKLAEGAGLVTEYLDIYHQILYCDPFPKESWLLQYEQQNLEKTYKNFSKGSKNLTATQIAAEMKYISKTLSNMRKYKKNLVEYYRAPDRAKTCAALIAEKRVEIDILYDHYQKELQPQLEGLLRKKSWEAVLRLIMETEYCPGLEKHVLIDGKSFYASEELSQKTQKIIKGLRAARKAIPERAYVTAAIKLTQGALKKLDQEIEQARAATPLAPLKPAEVLLANAPDSPLIQLLQHRRRTKNKLRRLEAKLVKKPARRTPGGREN